MLMCARFREAAGQSDESCYKMLWSLLQSP
jgi:hypothetical protein